MPEISRVPRSAEEARATYDRLAPFYDWLEGRWGRRARQRGLDLLNPKAGECILDVGCGTGRALVQIAQSVGASGHAEGIDISPRMVARARRRLARAGMTDRSRIVEADVLPMELETDRYDGVFLSFTLELFDTPEIPQVVHKCHEALKSHGRLCVVALTKSGPETRMRRIYEWAHQRWPTLLDCRPIYVERALSQANFDVVETQTLRLWGLPVAVVLGTPQ